MCGHHTNNYAEATVRLYKDHVLSRCKAYNAVALVDFTLTTMDMYYRHQLMTSARNGYPFQYLLPGYPLDSRVPAGNFILV